MNENDYMGLGKMLGIIKGKQLPEK